jgi:hypothetical protein
VGDHRGVKASSSGGVRARACTTHDREKGSGGHGLGLRVPRGKNGAHARPGCP